jgi:rhomboid protease GluP
LPGYAAKDSAVNDAIDLQPRRVLYALPLSRPIVTWVLLGLIAVVFGIETLSGGSTSTEVLVQMGAKVTPLIAAGQYWRLLTSMFLHVGFMHLFFNAYALVAIGTELERLLGWGRYLAIYLLSGLFGSLASYAFSSNLAAGASGAIFGLIGALGAFFTLHRQQLGNWGQRRLLNILLLIAINLFLGFTQPGIDNLAHLGGLVSGFALGWAMAPRYEPDPMHGRLVDRNRLGRYWPALALAVVLLAGGTGLATLAQRNSPQSHLWRVQDAVERQAWDEVVAEVEQALAEDPDMADTSLYFYLGLARNHLDQPRLAAEAYESALELEPDDPASHWNLALTYLQLERYAESKAHFETYLKLSPDRSEEVQPYLDELSRILSEQAP